jgi:serine/threonine protein kinase
MTPTMMMFQRQWLQQRFHRQPLRLQCMVPLLSMTAAVDLMLQVARGLKYLHSKRIVHRDVKSSNILVKALTGVPSLEYEEGYLSAKIADFGTSKTKISIV